MTRSLVVTDDFPFGVFQVNEYRLNDTILDLKIKLEAQTHGENYGLRKQIDVLKENMTG